MPTLEPLKSGYYIWKYVPSQALSIVALLLWLGAAGTVSWRMYKTRTWFCTAFVIGCFMEFAGFAARASAANHTGKLMPYIFSNILILLPPTLFAATIYMCLGRIIVLVGAEHLSPVRPSRLTKVFVWGDILSFWVQSGSSALFAMADKNPSFNTIGEALVIGGLAMQLISFCLFGITALVFHSRLSKNPTPRSFQVDQTWLQTIHMLYGVSSLIIVRSIFRIVEYVMGSGSTDGYLLKHEWTLYVFDTVPMLVVAGLFYWRYPDNLRPQSSDIHLEGQTSNGCLAQEANKFPLKA